MYLFMFRQTRQVAAPAANSGVYVRLVMKRCSGGAQQQTQNRGPPRPFVCGFGGKKLATCTKTRRFVLVPLRPEFGAIAN